ncbi:hypothetical protein M413DRAFT_240023 [Hebeloma cylindrosporum]|uniref:Uncharacterized protein n=1 Tax=Hebeloma cylindrosporum TaxID=76867 RepID=A0A0C3C4Y1_HEBCY|nr:hypothetical protein M413DRAFT_240023 [Hebeloma cylindrosporum h7]
MAAIDESCSRPHPHPLSELEFLFLTLPMNRYDFNHLSLFLLCVLDSALRLSPFSPVAAIFPVAVLGHSFRSYSFQLLDMGGFADLRLEICGLVV